MYLIHFQIQKFILKLQKLRGYSQFDEASTSSSNWELIQNSVALIKADVDKDIFVFKKFDKTYPELYDSDYDHIIKEIENLLQSPQDDKILLYQRFTYIIEQLKDKMYYLGFKSKLLLESDRDKYFLIETMLKTIFDYGQQKQRRNQDAIYIIKNIFIYIC